MGVYEHVMMEQHEQCTGNNEQQSFTPHSWAVLVKWRKYQGNAQSSQRRVDGTHGQERTFPVEGARTDSGGQEPAW